MPPWWANASAVLTRPTVLTLANSAPGTVALTEIAVFSFWLYTGPGYTAHRHINSALTRIKGRDVQPAVEGFLRIK